MRNRTLLRRRPGALFGSSLASLLFLFILVAIRLGAGNEMFAAELDTEEYQLTLSPGSQFGFAPDSPHLRAFSAAFSQVWIVFIDM